MKKLGLLAVMALLLVGCGGKEKTTVCTGNISGMDVEATVESKGDEVKKTKTLYTVDYASENYSEEDAKKVGEEWIAQYDGIDGLSGKYSLKDGKLLIEENLDYSKADMDQLQEAGLVEFDKEGTFKYISLKETLKQYKSEGATCKEK